MTEKDDATGTDDEAPKPDSQRTVSTRKRGSEADDGGPRAWGVPRFAKDFPDHAGLARLVRAFADGNYAAVNEGGTALAASTDASDEVRAAAKLLVARTQPDPTAKLLFAFAGALLVFLTAWWLVHDHPPGEAPAKEPPRPIEIVH